jgi:RNA polymerase sigma-70 factor (ECF subfamily)
MTSSCELANTAEVEMAGEGAGSTHDGRAPADDVPQDIVSSRERYIALVQPHLGAVLHLATALVGSADAEDAAQEAVLRGMQAWPALRDERALKSWLLRITYNVCIDLKRGRFGTHQQRTQPLPEADDEAIVAPLSGNLGGSEHAAALDLRAAINALDGGLRAVVVLRYYAGMDATAIGTLLHLPPATVRTRLRRALALLRLDLHPEDSLPHMRTEKGGR